MTIDAVGVVSNTFLIIAILFDPLRVLRKGAWITILNLSIADLIAAASSFMMIGSPVEFHIRNRIIYSFFEFFWMFGVSASFMLLTFLTIQTYIIVKYPIRSRFIISVKRIALFCSLVWAFAILFGFSNVMYVIRSDLTLPQNMKIHITRIAILELTVVVQLVLKIFIIREIVASAQNFRGGSERQSYSKHKEIAKTILILVVILIVTALPYFIAKQIEYLYKLDIVGGDTLVRLFSNYYEPVAVLNFAFNPILYSLRLPEYRRSLLALLPKCRKQRDTPPTLTSMRTAMSVKTAASPPEQVNEMTKL
jgi:hypothetical protein